MNKFLTIFILVLLPLCSFGQEKSNKIPLKVVEFKDNVNLPLTAKERLQIDEVYGEYAEKHIYSNAFRLKSIKDILRNRVEIQYITKESDKKDCQKLSEIPLLNSFVSDLERDKTFDPKTFNPLKYNFAFHSRGSTMYQVDNTNYFITIKSQYH
ncbi:MAG: hypothetical protein CMC05_01685 [Flavobacteriaceae bacterium]|jgi:hypothetical protein|uniref:hypothetical protein n=1 Tax=Winogradskyella poriferorum TaxID=307627 RepID=UPI000C8F17F6|nr:hypothetical protein [Flavobacteriaceae bacterium]|tara:strand:- start:2848 stop:3309 length:462 start_codon:yes stop_codon:yes gene_type:complete